jgi:hypothetical protein
VTVVGREGGGYVLLEVRRDGVWVRRLWVCRRTGVVRRDDKRPVRP